MLTILVRYPDGSNHVVRWPAIRTTLQFCSDCHDIGVEFEILSYVP